jgi:hypothetical protein
MSGARDRTIPALMVYFGCGAGEELGKSDLTRLTGGATA